jgi:Coenzyme PQQ synthesis protein D (PqqD)
MNDPARWDEISTRRVVVPRHVVHRSFASETVLLNVQTGHYHGMDAVGGRFFETLIGAGSVGNAATALAEEYEQPVERIQEDMGRFCEELRELGLIELAG